MKVYVLTMTRRALRHHVLILGRERWRETQGREVMPLCVSLHPESLDHVLIDDDPKEQFTITPGGPDDYRYRLMGTVPLQGDVRIPVGMVDVLWPEESR